MHDSELNGKKLFVGRFQKKFERVSTLKKMHEEKKQERHNRYMGINLYIKNLDDTIDDERLRKEFVSFGTITSAKVRQKPKTVALTRRLILYSRIKRSGDD